ncbi:MAG: glycosyltransferase [Acidimicrobiaceae bacterium]|nr:glycosyltransferase [Acidimicrobiaceae bacterium]
MSPRLLHEVKVISSGIPRISVVLPAYCAAHCIGDTISELREHLSDEVLNEVDCSAAVLSPVGSSADSGARAAAGLEIVVVDDGSDDETAEKARAAGADVVLRLPENRGKGAAVRAGILAASGRVVVFTDADLAYPPSQIPELLETVESGVDIAVGNRHHPDSVEIDRRSMLRSFGSRAVNVIQRLLMLSNCQDTQCGLKVFHHTAVQRLFPVLTIDGFAFDIELIYLARRYGLSLKEMPVKAVGSSTSTVRMLRDGLVLLRDMLRIRVRALLGRYPPPSAGF